MIRLKTFHSYANMFKRFDISKIIKINLVKQPLFHGKYVTLQFKSIEKRLKETGLKYVTRFVDSKMCNKHGKHGVAECKKEEILRVLDNDLIDENPFKNCISQAEFNSFGFMNSQEKRNEISEKLHLGICNSKILFKRMNYNGITSEMIEEVYGNK